MQFKILGSDSSGNCYIFESSTGEILICELGVRLEKIKQAINFNLGKVAGAIVTHEHGDHSKCLKEALQQSINVYASAGTHRIMGTDKHHRAKVLKHLEPVQIGSYKVMPFNVHHDCAEPFGFIINHPECGNTLFLTDTKYSDYPFKNLNNIIIEANYCKDIIDRKVKEGMIELLRNRILKSHMSIQTCIETLQANNLEAVNNIILIHLSNSNSNQAEFKDKVEKVTGKTVHIADTGIIIDLNKTPF